MTFDELFAEHSLTPEERKALVMHLATLRAQKTVEALQDCPHAAPHRYCDTCPVSPCPIGLGPNVWVEPTPKAVGSNRQLCRSQMRAEGNTMDTKAEIAAGEALIPTLPSVLGFALIGSASYLPEAGDVDFAVLIEPSINAVDYAAEMANGGWGKCGEYDGVGGIWAAVRRENLNLMVTHDPKFFTDYKTAMEVCKALNLVHKQDRIAVCQIVRDGKRADEVMTHAKLYGSPLPPAPAQGVLDAA